jgi:hypothetical protein
VSIYGVSIVKEILRARGVLPSAATRDPGAIPLDAHDLAELRGFLEGLEISASFAPDAAARG